jgi:TPR repeat protein
MVEVAMAYEEGRGTVADKGEAISWYRLAAEAGNSDARWRLGKRLYDQGRSAEGLCLITRAATSGQPSAQQFLAGLADSLPVAKGRDKPDACLQK